MTALKCPFDYLLALDFETTSEEINCDYAFEVIQFSVAVLEVRNNKIRDDLSFNEYVRPVINPILSDYCSAFTGIAQETLDRSPTFGAVYDQFLQWLKDNKFQDGKFAIVSDSRQDMWRIAQYQLKLINKTMPAFFRQYINLFRVYQAEQERLGPKEALGGTNIAKMAEFYGLDFVGRAHDAFDDCRMLCRITQRALTNGALVSINEELVCNAFWRRTPLVPSPDWRLNFIPAMKVFERVMPLVVKAVNPALYNSSQYGICKYCKSGPVDCARKRHRQFPRSFYASESQPVVFAKHANYFN